MTIKLQKWFSVKLSYREGMKACGQEIRKCRPPFVTNNTELIILHLPHYTKGVNAAACSNQEGCFV